MQEFSFARSWWLFAAGVVLLGVLSLRAPSGGGFLDLKIYRETTDRMKTGEGYYPAMTEAMTAFDAGPAGSVRAYRLPTIFWLWRYCCLTWPATFLLVVAIGVLVGVASLPIIGLLTVLWLTAGLHGSGLDAWAFVELWTVPFCIGSVIAIRRGAWGWAAILALCAALVREQAVLVLLGGLVAAWYYGRSLWPWLASLTTWSAFLAWHICQVQPYLVSVGREQPMVGGGGAGAVAAMAGPYTYGLGLAIVVYALWKTRWTASWWLVAPLLILVPLSGLVVARNYWGFLVLPTALALLGQVFVGSGKSGRFTWRFRAGDSAAVKSESVQDPSSIDGDV
jgi:hypothetical protein